MPRDLSQTTGNPTNSLEQALPRLKDISDTDVLATEALAIVGQHRTTGGISARNYEKFSREIMRLKQQGDAPRMVGYLYNYVLAGSGMPVIN